MKKYTINYYFFCFVLVFIFPISKLNCSAIKKAKIEQRNGMPIISITSPLGKDGNGNKEKDPNDFVKLPVSYSVKAGLPNDEWAREYLNKPDPYYKDCKIPDFGLTNYAISFTIGDTMKDRIGDNPFLPFEYMMNKEGYEVEVCTNRLYGTKDINIKLDYKSDEEWYEMMKYAFEVYERLNIQLYVRK